MTPEQMMGMIRAGHDVEHVLDIASAESNAEFRCWLLKESGPEAVARYDAKIKDIESGVYGARMAWHSISEAQRRALRFADKNGGRLFRPRHHTEYLGSEVRGPYPPIRVRTLRNLCARELMAWDGGAFQPEDVVVITERGRFTLAHGPTHPTG